MPRYERIKVTPRVAREWLAKNAENNRNPKPNKIAQYARDMSAGHWIEDSGLTIAVTPEGKLINGQNRLMAVIQAQGGPRGYIEFDFAFDVPEAAMVVTDTAAAKTFADVLKHAEVRERMRASSIVRWVTNWERGIPMGRGANAGVTHSEMWERWQQDPEAFDAAVSRATDAYARGLGAVAPVGTAFFLFYKISPDEAHQFFDQLITGANLPQKHAALLLRDRMGRARLDRLTRPETLALYIKAWNIERKKEERDRLQLTRQGDLTNLNFPRPI